MITVTAATGRLGRLVTTGLLQAGVPANQLRAVVRDPSKAADLAAQGVDVRRADYLNRGDMAAALAATDRLYFISGSEVGQRVPQHLNVIDAAEAAGVPLLVYTSAPQANTSTAVIAPEHKATEEAIAASHIPAVVLRHNWYLANYDQAIAQGAATGAIYGAAGSGRVWAASHTDYADAAVAVLTATDSEPGVYELAGTTSFTMDELAAEVADQAGHEVSYIDLPVDGYVEALQKAGLDAATARFVAAADTAVADGQLDHPDPTLTEWIGRPTTTLAEHVKAVLAG